MHEKDVSLRIPGDRITPADAAKPIIVKPEGVAIEPDIFSTKGLHPLRSVLAAQIVEIVIAATHRQRRFDLGEPVQGIVDLPVNFGAHVT